MLITDNIYGKVNIKEPILLELVESPSVLRLKKISQLGVPDKYYHIKNFSRYEHTVGVMVLLRKLGATLEEQVAGLLHDVSVLAFSHVTDWVFGKGREGIEDYHDLIHKEFVNATEIPNILEKHNFILKRILDEKNFTLLEQPIPDLCADRIDYALREFEYWLNPKIVNECIVGLENYSGEIVFNNKKAAFDFSVNFLELQTQNWGGWQSMIRYHLFSNALNLALNKGIIAEKDFYKDESTILDKLNEAKDRRIAEVLSVLEDKELKSVKQNSGERIFRKFRHVNPKVIEGGKLVRLSELDNEFVRVFQKHEAINRKGLIV